MANLCNISKTYSPNKTLKKSVQNLLNNSKRKLKAIRE